MEKMGMAPGMHDYFHGAEKHRRRKSAMKNIALNQKVWTFTSNFRRWSTRK